MTYRRLMQLLISKALFGLQPLWNQSSPRTNNCLAYSNYSYVAIDPKEFALSCSPLLCQYVVV